MLELTGAMVLEGISPPRDESCSITHRDLLRHVSCHVDDASRLPPGWLLRLEASRVHDVNHRPPLVLLWLYAI
jgi:hypothetical protein